MSQPHPSRPWVPGEVIVYDLFVRDARFVRCWTRIGEPGGAPHEFYWETYWGALGGGETVPTAALLHTDANHTPTIYEVWSDRLPVRTVRFQGPTAVVELTDGSTHQVVGLGPADIVLQSNAIGQLALYAASLPGSESEVATVFFSPEALTFQTVVATRGASGPDGTTWSTSLGAELICDHDGRLVRMEATSQQSRAEPVQALFPEIDREELRRPRLHYAAPEELAVELCDTTFDSPHGPVGAALSRPRDGGNDPNALPGVLLLQGSGRHDRHGMAPGLDTGTHELVDRLSERGFITLRYDSPGAGTTPYGKVLDGGLDAIVDVAEAALASLESHPSVRDGCAVVGHSLGALVALLLAERAGPERVRALALLAPAGRTLDHLMLDQTDRESRRLELPEEQARQRHDTLRALFERVRSEEQSRPDGLTLGMPHVLLDDLLTTDPAALLARVAVPVLICQGGKDIQVNAATDTLLLAEAAGRTGADVEVRLFPGLDHLFMVEPGASSPQRYFVRRPIGDGLIGSLDEWLHRHLPTATTARSRLDHTEEV